MANLLDNPYAGWLEDTPDALYRALIPANRGSTFYDYWKSRAGDTYNNYMGALGKQALGGNAPTLTFADYLGNMDWLNPYYNTALPYRNTFRMNWNLK